MTDPRLYAFVIGLVVLAWVGFNVWCIVCDAAEEAARAGRATPRAGARLGHSATIDYRGDGS